MFLSVLILPILSILIFGLRFALMMGRYFVLRAVYSAVFREVSNSIKIIGRKPEEAPAELAMDPQAGSEKMAGLEERTLALEE